MASVQAGVDLSELQDSAVDDLASELVALRTRTEALEQQLAELTRAMEKEE